MNSKFPLSFKSDKKVKSEEIDQVIYDQLGALLDNPNLSDQKLTTATLRQMDHTWKDHLEAMDMLQSGIHLQAMTGRKPEEIFVERGFETYQASMAQMKTDIARNILPAVAKVAPGTVTQ